MKQEPNARWDYISNYVASQQQILVGSFFDISTTTIREWPVP